MSKHGATELKALKVVLDEHISIADATGPDAVCQWIKTWFGKSLFRTGTWEQPEVVGDRVTVVSMFDAKAAGHRGVLTLTISDAGVITTSTLRLVSRPNRWAA